MAIRDLTKIRKHLFLCNGGSCKILGAEESTAAIRACIEAQGLSEEIHTTKTLCNGRCKDGPIVISQPDGTWFKRMSAEEAKGFVLGYLSEQILPEGKVLFVYGKETISPAT